MLKSEQINELSAALAKAQSEIENASKTSSNPHFKSKYADLAEILNTVRPVFSAHGLAIVQMPSFESGIAHVETLLTHSSGQWISNVCSAPVGKQDAQGVGSAITYLRRYSLAAFAGVAQEDDDGNSAVGKHAPQQQAAKPQPQPQPMTAEIMEKAAQSIRDGKANVQRIAKAYILSDEQRAALIAIETQALAEQQA
jgi:hypothetical protein